MEQILEFINPTLAVLIVALAQALKGVFKNIPGQIASIIATVVVTAVWFLFDDGLTMIEGIISFLGAVTAYDFILKPVLRVGKSKEKDPPVGGGGSGPLP